MTTPKTYQDALKQIRALKRERGELRTEIDDLNDECVELRNALAEETQIRRKLELNAALEKTAKRKARK